jgi:hypothetical protein
MKKLILASILLNSLLVPALTLAEEQNSSSAIVQATDEAINVEPSMQKIVIQKIITQKSTVIEAGKAQDQQFVGINGASFKVYDVTYLLEETLKPYLDKVDAYEKLKAELQELTSKTSVVEPADKSEADEKMGSKSHSFFEGGAVSEITEEVVNDDDLKSADSLKDKELELSDLLKSIQKNPLTTNQLTGLLTDLARKENLSKLKVFAQGNTKTADDKDGIFEFTVPYRLGKYQAYYVVNDKVDDNETTLSDPFVMITPLINIDNGTPLETAYIYPKSQYIPKEIVSERLPNTGIKSDWIDQLVNLLFK